MTTTITVTARDSASGRRSLTERQVPAVVYGPQQESIAIAVDGLALEKVRRDVGESTIVTLTGLDEDIEVLIKQIDLHPSSMTIDHADFYAIERGKEMTTTVPFEFTGEAPVEKSNTGTVTRVMQDISVTCRPSKLPAHITIDLSELDTTESKVTVGDLPQLEGVTYGAPADEAVAIVTEVGVVNEDDDPAPVDMSAVSSEEGESVAS